MSMISFKLEEELKEKLRGLADKEKRSMSNLIKFILEKYLENNND